MITTRFVLVRAPAQHLLCKHENVINFPTPIVLFLKFLAARRRGWWWRRRRRSSAEIHVTHEAVKTPNVVVYPAQADHAQQQ